MNMITYGQFLSKALLSADRQSAANGGIARKYGISPVGVDMVCSSLTEGWDAFEELSERIKGSYISWTTGVSAALGGLFCVDSNAIVNSEVLRRISKSLSFWGGDEKAVNSMYDYRNLILSVHRIGQSKLSNYKQCINNEEMLQGLKKDIVAELINKNN